MEPIQMTEPAQNRRYMDEHGDRIVKLEVGFNYMKGAMDNFGSSMSKLENHMQALATSAELQNHTNQSVAQTLSQISTTLSELQKNDFKVSTLEDWRSRVDAHLGACDTQHQSTKDKLNKTDEMVRRIYWIVPIAMGAIALCIELIDTFHIIK
jgi:chromosome segregation ATPase